MELKQEKYIQRELDGMGLGHSMIEVGRWWNTLLWTGTEGQDDDVVQAEVVPDTVRVLCCPLTLCGKWQLLKP